MVQNMFNSGAQIDYRPEQERSKDFLFEEIVASAAPVTWTEKKEEEWRMFPIFNQDGSGSCVAQTGAKMMGIAFQEKVGSYVHFSASHIYQRRVNAPKGGMIATNCFDLMREGVTFEFLAPSQDMRDSEMDSVKITDSAQKLADVFKIGNYITVKTGDVDMVASIIQQTDKGVMVWFYFKHDEWGKEFPEVKHNIDLYGSGTSRHSVTAVDFTLVAGKKYLVIEDSWGPGTGKGGRRLISEDFFKKRNFFVGYFMNFDFDTNKSHVFTFEKTLKLGMRDGSVSGLQKTLQALGYFPTNVDATGYFGSITKRAVVSLQKDNGLEPDGIVGPKTGKLLEQI